jgi:hypothetical protein
MMIEMEDPLVVIFLLQEKVVCQIARPKCLEPANVVKGVRIEIFGPVLQLRFIIRGGRESCGDELVKTLVFRPFKPGRSGTYHQPDRNREAN